MSLTLEKLKLHEKEFAEQGYFIVDLCNPEYVHEVAKMMQQHLQSITKNSNITLENYHTFYDNDDEHYQIQYQMLEFFREQQFAQKVIQSNSEIYQYIVGPDLEIQKDPYFRITRPFKPKDNIGYHRDTFYGTGPGEISTVIPFVDLQANNSLSVFPKSHVMPDALFKFNQIVNQDVPKDSKRHKMGFLYAPKILESEVSKKMVPIPLKLGQALVFMLSIIHGSEENTSQKPRWSTDIRIKNALIPLNKEMKKEYYLPFKSSATSQTFEKLMTNV